MEEAHTAERLLVAMAKQDHDAFRKLYQLTAPKLFAITLRMCRNRADAETALIETFVTVSRHASDFDPRRMSGMVWLAAIARNRALHLRQRMLKKARQGTGSYQNDTPPLPDFKYAEGEHPALDTLIRHMEALAPDERDALLVSYYEGGTREQIAERLSIAPNKIEALLSSGISKLRTLTQSAS